MRFLLLDFRLEILRNMQNSLIIMVEELDLGSKFVCALCNFFRLAYTFTLTSSETLLGDLENLLVVVSNFGNLNYDLGSSD